MSLLRWLFGEGKRSSKQRRGAGHLFVMPLEERRVLDATFTETATGLVLNGFDGDETQLTVRESGGDYIFRLTDNTESWSGTAITATGAGSRDLRVSKVVANAWVDGIQATGNTSNSVLFSRAGSSAIDFSGMLGVLRFTDFTSISQADPVEVSSLEIVNASGNVTLDTSSNDFGKVTIDTAGDVVVDDTNNIQFAGTNAANSLVVDADGSITDAAGTSTVVTDSASFLAGGAITLGDDVTDSWTFGSLAFDAAGQAVTITESDATQLAETATISQLRAGSLTLSSTGAITDATDTDGVVTGDAAFSAGGLITLGDDVNDAWTFGSLGFSATGNTVTITEADATNLRLTGLLASLTASNLILNSGGGITDSTGTIGAITGDASFIASGTITLGGELGDAWSFGGLGFSAAAHAVEITESDSTQLKETSGIVSLAAASLILTSGGAITDAADTDGSITNDASFIAGGLITLGDDAVNDSWSFGSLGFSAATHAVAIRETGSTNLKNTAEVTSITAGSLILESTAGITDTADTDGIITGETNFIAAGAVTLGNDTAQDSWTFGTLAFDAVGQRVDIREVNDTLLQDTATIAALRAGTLVLTSTGSISDATDTNGVVTGDANFVAGDAITLGDVAASDSWTFGALAFDAAGHSVDVRESDATLLKSTADIATLRADSLVVRSTAEITDETSTQMTITSDASFLAGAAITIGDGGSTLNFGSVAFDALGSSVEIHESSSMSIEETAAITTLRASDLVLEATGSITDGADTDTTITGAANLIATAEITLGDSAGDSWAFGTLAFDAVGQTVRVTEADSIVLANTTSIANLRAGTLMLNAGGSITDAADTDATITGAASLLATAAITLGGDVNDSWAFGTLAFDAAGQTVRVTETDAIVLANTADVSTLRAGTLMLNATGSITDATDTDATITGAGSLLATAEITLGDSASDSWVFGTLAFDAVGQAVRITQSNAIVLANTADIANIRAASIMLNAGGSITDAVDTDAAITGAASLIATSDITLGDDANDSWVFGTLAFNATGQSVRITEANSMQLANTADVSHIRADNLLLNATGTISDAADTDATITGAASLIATSSITLGDDAVTDAWAFGSIAFDAAGQVVEIHEANATQFAETADISTLRAGSLVYQSQGAITDATDTDAVITGAASFIGGGDITLGDQASDSWALGTLAFDAVGQTVTITESDATTLAESSAVATLRAGTLNLNSGGDITDVDDTDTTITGAATFSTADNITLANDADVDGFGSLTINGIATFTSTDGNNIDVGIRESGGDPIDTDVAVNFGSLAFSSVGGRTRISEDSDVQLRASSTDELVLLTSGNIAQASGAHALTTTGDATFQMTGASTNFELAGQANSIAGTIVITSDLTAATPPDASLNDLRLRNTHASADLGFLPIAALNDLELRFDAAAIALPSLTANGELIVESGLGITDQAGASITVTGAASFIAGDAITFNDTLAVGTLAFDANGQTVTIVEADSTTLAESSSITQLRADTLNLSSGGSIDDAFDTDLNITTNATFSATTFITLADDNDNDSNGGITVGGLARLTSSSNSAIDVGVESDGSTSDSAVSIGSLSFDNANGVTNGDTRVTVTGAIALEGVNDTGNLTLVSTGAGSAVTDTSGSLLVRGTATIGADSITLDSNVNLAALNFQSTGVVDVTTASNLQLTGDNDASTLRLDVIGNVTDGPSTQLTATSADVTATGTITIGDDLPAGSDDTILVDSWDVAGTVITIGSDRSGTVTLADVDSTGDFTLASAGTVDQSGAVSILGDMNLTLTSAGDILLNDPTNSVAQDVNVAGSVGQFSLGNAHANATVTDLSGIATLTGVSFNFANARVVLPSLSITGNLVVVSGQGISQAGLLTVNGTTDLTLNNSGFDIDLDDFANVLNSTITVSGSPSNLYLQNAAAGASIATLPLTGLNNLTLDFANSAIVLPQVSITGNMIVRSGGNIGQTGLLDVDGTATFELLTAGTAIELHTEANEFENAVATIAPTIGSRSTVRLRNADDDPVMPTLPSILQDLELRLDNTNIVLPTLDVAGTTTLATNGTITDAATATINSLDLTAATVVLDQTTISGTLTFNVSGTLNVNTASAITLSGANQADTANLTSTGGAITDQAGASLTAGTSFVVSGTSITLDGTTSTPQLTFDSSDSVDIDVDGSTQLAGTNRAATLTLNVASGSGTATLASVEDTTIDVMGAATIAVRDDLTLANDADNDGVGRFDVDGLLMLTSTNGGNISVGRNGAADSDAITTFNRLTFNNSGGIVSIHEDDDVVYVGTNTADSLVLSADATLQDDDATPTTLTVNGNASLQGTDIIVGNTNGTANFGTLSLTATTANVNESSATTLAGSNVLTTLTLTSSGAIDNAASANVSVTGTTTLNGNGVTLGTQAGDSIVTPSLDITSGTTVAIEADSAVNLAATNISGDLSINASGDITDTAAMIVSGDVVFERQSTTTGSIVLDAANLDLNNVTARTLDATGGIADGIITISELTDVDIASIETLGSVTIAATNGEVAGGAAATDVRAGSAVVNAATGIGRAAAIDLVAESLQLTTTSGDVNATSDSSTLTGDVTATLSTGGGSIDLDHSGGQVLIVSSAIATANVDLSASAGDLTATSATAGSSAVGDGDFRLTTTGSGDVTIGSVLAEGDTATINSAGSIVAEGSDTTVDILATTIDLNALGGIGEAADALDLSTVSLDADTTSGDIFVTNASSSTTGAVVVNRLTTGNGAITYEQVGTELLSVLAANATAATSANGSVTITNQASVDFDSITASGTLAINAAGTINERAASADAAVDLSASVLDLDATTGIGDVSTLSVNAVTVSADTTSGDVLITDTTAADVSSVTTGEGNIIFSAPSMTIGLVSAVTSATAGLVELIATIGSITESGSDVDVDIAAVTLVATATSGFGTLANPIETNVGTVDIDAGSGVVGIGDSGSLVVGASGLGTNGIQTTGAAIAVTTGGSLTLVEDIQASGANSSIGINASGAVNLGTGVVRTDSGAVGSVDASAFDVVAVEQSPGVTVSDDGFAQVQITLNDVSGRNFGVTVDWQDATAPVDFFNVDGPTSFIVDHTYAFNPDGSDSAATIPIIVTIAFDQDSVGGPTGIVINSGGQSTNSVTNIDLQPSGTGIAPAINIVPATFVTNPEAPPSFGVREQQARAAQQEVQVADAITLVSTAASTPEKQVILRVVSPNGEEIESITLDTSQLNDLSSLFKKLPDNRYRIYLIMEDGTSRLVLDVAVRNGRPYDPNASNIETPERPAAADTVHQSRPLTRESKLDQATAGKTLAKDDAVVPTEQELLSANQTTNLMEVVDEPTADRNQRGRQTRQVLPALYTATATTVAGSYLLHNRRARRLRSNVSAN